jgi:FkbM family methyltransferase
LEVARSPRKLLMAVGVLLLSVGALLLAERSNRGRVVLVRSYVRIERAWERWFPLKNAGGLLRRFDPLMARVGVLRPVRVEVEPGVSLLLDPADDVSRTILISLSNTWESEVWDAISSGLFEGAVFLDVGAYVGYDTLRASVRVGPDGRIVAFEPNPTTLAVLRANIDASRAKNVVVEPIACTDIEQTLTLFDATLGGNAGSSSLSQGNAGPATRSYTVRGRPIDAVVRELGLTRLDVVKADVEGAELLVVRGAAETLKRFHPKLILEVVPRQLANMGTSVEELEAFVKALGYNSTRSIDYKNREWTVR